MRKARIRELLREVIGDESELLSEDTDKITRERIAADLALIAFADIDDITDQSYRSILAGKIKCLELLGKWRSMFTDRTEVEVTGNLELRLKDAIKRLAAAEE